MPRGRLAQRARRKEMQALRYEQLCQAAKAARREHHAQEAALALRKATPDWVDLDKQLKQHQLEVEMDAMEACIDERRPKIPILNFDLMPGLKPPAKTQTEPRLADHKTWPHPGNGDHRHPADDWRNYE